MSKTLTHPALELPVHPSKRHPLTGALLRAVGVLPNGKVIWPILGGDDTDPVVERPDDVTEEDWEALGDNGKVALVRERDRANKAESQVASLRAQLAKNARPAPPKNPVPAPAPVPGTAVGDQGPDIDAIVAKAVEAAIKPFQDRDAQREAQDAAKKVQDAVIEAAKPRLVDATDALQINLTTVLDDNGAADPAKVTKAIDDLLATKPHLAKTDTRFAPPGIGGGGPAAISKKDQVAAILTDMQRTAGVRPPAAN